MGGIIDMINAFFSIRVGYNWKSARPQLSRYHPEYTVRLLEALLYEFVNYTGPYSKRNHRLKTILRAQDDGFKIDLGRKLYSQKPTPCEFVFS